MVVPVIHCFDARYVPPAAVAFLSMLEHANPAHEYRLYVLHSDIPPAQQARLQEVVGRFPNATLAFVDMHGRFADAFAKAGVKGHYAAEMFHKLVLPSLFPQYDKAIVTDVDVLYRGDVSEEFAKFDADGPDYVAGVGFGDLDLACFRGVTARDYAAFTPEERARLVIGAGFMFFSLKRMRADGLEAKFLACLRRKVRDLRQPEQDVINLCAWPHIKMMRPGVMACTYLWEWTTPEERARLQGELDTAVQVHFATAVKPWNDSACLFLEEWFGYLMRTPFLRDVLHGGFDYTGKWSGRLFGIPVLRRKVTTRRTTIRLFGFLPITERPLKG